MKQVSSAICAIFGAFVSGAFGAVTVSSSSTGWVALSGNYDYPVDQQTGQPESDIVGATNDPGFFTAFDNNGLTSNTDGVLSFRVRLDAAGGNTNNPAFTRVLWVGIDANSDGALDVFMGVDNQGNSSTLGIYAPGTGSNTSPNTTSINSTAAKSYTIDALNYNYRPVNFSTDGGTTNDITSGGTDTDYYLSFSVPFADIASFLSTKSIAITDASPLRYVLGTSTQHNSLNQDLGNVNGSTNSTTTWETLGGFSPTLTANGSPYVVPEPSSLMLGLAALPVLFRRRRHS